jgi:sugar-specific transcriptional regulator TrmB
MCADSFDDPQAVAIAQLEQFGLSTYAARTFVALVRIDRGTATDVSNVVDVPRTRVYGAVEELQQRGLVDVRNASPKEFWAVSPETATRTFERELTNRQSRLVTALDALSPDRETEPQRGVWTVEGRTPVTERVIDMVETAEDEIVYMTVESLLTDPLVDALEAAADRDVSIRLAGISPEVQEHIQDEVPGATTFESLWLWSDTPAGRLLMVDREKTLVSALVNGSDAAPDDPRSETAIWGQGEHNSLVVVLKAIFTWRLDEEN